MQLIYYVASSIDGYIADPDGGVDWLDTLDSESGDHGYGELYRSIDSLVMGGETYRWLQEYGEWPYADRPCWVMTHQDLEKMADSISMTDASPSAVMEAISAAGQSRAWLVGGGRLAGSFHREGLITEYYITWIPYALGAGIPLLGGEPGDLRLRLLESKAHESGVLQARYSSYSYE